MTSSNAQTTSVGPMASTRMPAALPTAASVARPPDPNPPRPLRHSTWVRPLALLLLAVGVALLALASAQLLGAGAYDYLLLAWLALWLLLFAGCLLLAGTAHRMVQRSAEALDNWARRRAQARADARFAALAQHDARLQAELRMQHAAQPVAPTRPAR